MYIWLSLKKITQFSTGSARTSAILSRLKKIQVPQIFTRTNKTFSHQSTAAMPKDPQSTMLDHCKPVTKNQRHQTIDNPVSFGLNQIDSPASVPSRQNNAIVGDISKIFFL